MTNTEKTWTPIHTSLMKYISNERCNKISRYHSDEDRILSLYAAILTRLVLVRLFHCSNNCLAFTTLPNGKPIIDTNIFQPTSLVDFNFSHTRNALLFGITTNGQIGVDIEKIHKAPFQTMKQIFHPNEIAYVNAAENSERELRFYEIWTRKEAYSKCSGVGLSEELTSVNTLISPISNYIYTWVHQDYVCSVMLLQTTT